MAKLHLTDQYIRTRARPAQGHAIDYDEGGTGFAVRFAPSGPPTFLFCYGIPGANGAKRRMAIGRWSESSGKTRSSMLEAMRQRARELRMLVDAKRDPYAEQAAEAKRLETEREDQERQRVAEQAAREAEVLREQAELTVEQLWEHYVTEHGPRLRSQTLQSSVLRMKRYLKPAWGTRKAALITKADVIALLRPIRAAGKRAEVVHVLALVNGLFNFAVDDDGIPSITENPARGLKKKLVSKADRVQPKERALVTARDLRAFYVITRPGRYMHADAADCLRLMMLTGCRPSEAAGIEWTEIDFHARLWSKPDNVEGRSKSRRADVVPLVDDAMAIVTARRGNGSRYVFPSGRSKRKANGGGPGVLTEHRLASALRDVTPRLKRMKVEPFAPHDLRRTVTTGLFDLDVSEYIVKRTLNHSTQGVTDTHYNKSAFIRQRRAALEAWAQHLRSTIRYGVQAPVSNVVQIRRAEG